MRLRVFDRHDMRLRFALGGDLFGREENTGKAGGDSRHQEPRFNGSPHWGHKPYQSSQAGFMLAPKPDKPMPGTSTITTRNQRR